MPNLSRNRKNGRYVLSKIANPGGTRIMNRMLWIKAISFFLLILFMWFDDEYLIPKIVSERVPISAKTIAGILDSIWVVGLFFLSLAVQIRDMRKIKVLEGILCVCANCKRIRDENNHWNQIEEYIHNRTDADFSHSICPDCGVKLYGDLFLQANAAKPEAHEPLPIPVAKLKGPVSVSKTKVTVKKSQAPAPKKS